MLVRDLQTDVVKRGTAVACGRAALSDVFDLRTLAGGGPVRRRVQHSLCRPPLLRRPGRCVPAASALGHCPPGRAEPVPASGAPARHPELLL